LFALLVILSSALTGCQTAPEYRVCSYEKIKEDLADQPDIIYPDINKYDKGAAWSYKVNLYQEDRRIRNGYAVYSSDDTSEIDFAAEGVVTEFSHFEIGCLSIEYYYTVRDPCPPLNPNVIHRNIRMSFHESSLVVDSKDPDRDYVLYEDGTVMGSVGYMFDYDGYRYYLNAATLLTPKDLKTITPEEKLRRARLELLVIVDDILDKGGVPR
jgi:hypothetical protein